MPLKLPKYNLFVDKSYVAHSATNPERNTLVIYNISDTDMVKDDFFGKILQSVHLKLGLNASLLQCHSENRIVISEILSSGKFRFVLLFGLTPNSAGLMLRLAPFKVTALGEIQFVQFPSLHTISGNIEYKKNLWETLKELYGR